MIIQLTETEDARYIKISFNQDLEFDIHKEVKQLEERLNKENSSYPWYAFGGTIVNTKGYVKAFEEYKLTQDSIYDFVKSNKDK